MKLIISLMLTIALFPILNISYRAFGINDITCMISFLMYGIQSALITGVTFFTGALLKGKYKKILQILIVTLLGALFALICSLIVKDVSLSVWIVSCIILAVSMEKIYYIHNIDFSSPYLFITISLIFTICTFIGWQTQVGSSKLINTILYLIFCIMFAIVTNRNHLQNIINRRTQNIDSVPKNIFKYNIKLTLILCAIPIPFVIFSNKIGSAIYNLLIAIFKGIVYIGRLISSMLTKDTQNIEETENNLQAYQPYYESKSNMLLDITVILSIGLITFLIYYYHEEIIKKFKEIVWAIKFRLKKSLTYKETSNTIQIPSSDGYIDYIKDISTHSLIYNKKSFKKDYHSYLKMDNSIETFCFGYTIATNAMNILGYNIKPFNTVTDISENLNSFSENEHISKIYLSIRYNQALPTNQDKILLDKVLNNIYKTL